MYNQSYFNSLLHEKHRDKQTEQFACYTGKPVDNGAGSEDGQQEQQECGPNTNPAASHDQGIGIWAKGECKARDTFQEDDTN